jgi:hypothetical protein
VHLGRTRPSRKIRLHFSLKYRNAETLHDEWTQRSDPKHALYGQWLSLEELEARFAPSRASVALVQAKLRAAGALSVLSSRMGHTEATMTVAAAERLLHCVFHSFRNKRTGQVLHRALDGERQKRAGGDSRMLTATLLPQGCTRCPRLWPRRLTTWKECVACRLFAPAA